MYKLILKILGLRTYVHDVIFIIGNKLNLKFREAHYIRISEYITCTSTCSRTVQLYIVYCMQNDVYSKLILFRNCLIIYKNT